MKKFLLSAVAVLFFVAANAQTVESSRFFDNWSFGVQGGVAMDAKKKFPYVHKPRAEFGVTLTKQITPVLGLGAESNFLVNASTWPARYNGKKSGNKIDAFTFDLFGTINLNNWFAGYAGNRRLFEVELLGGVGLIDHLYPKSQKVDNYADIMAKVGANLNFNLGEKKAWTIGIKPAVVWELEPRTGNKARMHASYAHVEVLAGITYHFKNSNGTHSFKINDKKYTQEELDALNSKVNALRNQVDAANAELNNANARNKALEDELNACKNKKPEVVEVKPCKPAVPETLVTFNQGKSIVTKTQLPNVQRVATFLQHHPDAKVVIKGYASPEGNLEFNKKLATARAEAVKKILIERFKIDASRIEAEGQGIGDMFEEPDWNRVSICAIEK